MDWLRDLDRLAERLDAERHAREQALAGIDADARVLMQAVAEVHAAWSGSNIGHHAELYFDDFARPAHHERFSPDEGTMYGLPRGWVEKSYEEVVARIESIAGVGLDDLRRRAGEQVAACKALRDDALVAMAPVTGLADHEREKKLLDELERAEWGSAGPAALPGGITTDLRAVSEGQRFAPHQRYYRLVRLAQSQGDACREFLSRALRGVRQTAVAARASAPSEMTADRRLQDLLAMLRRFATFALHLQRRPRARPPFDIADEYDVQDLVRAVLSLYTDDGVHSSGRTSSV